MPALQFYADAEDFVSIFQRLKADSEIACIFPNGQHKWIAGTIKQTLPDGKYVLWHMPSGPLPLLTSPDPETEPAWIADPFSGWTELLPGLDSNVPFFGSIPQIITLGVQRQATEDPEGIGQSYFGWIGSRYKSVGLPAAPETQRWWRSLGRWFKSAAVKKIAALGPVDGPDTRIWAFPSAYRQILGGNHRDANPLV